MNSNDPNPWDYLQADSPQGKSYAHLCAPGSWDALCMAQPTWTHEQARQRAPLTTLESARMMNVRHPTWFLTGFRRTPLLAMSVEGLR